MTVGEDMPFRNGKYTAYDCTFPSILPRALNCSKIKVLVSKKKIHQSTIQYYVCHKVKNVPGKVCIIQQKMCDENKYGKH